MLDPQDDMKIKEHAFTNTVEMIQTYEKRLFQHPMHENESLEEVYENYLEKIQVNNFLVPTLYC